jgi:hypothetical protein
VHKTALERVQQQGNLAKQMAEDATNQAQEGLREAKASKLLAQVPPSRFVSACKLLYSKRMCGRYRLKFSLALPLCFALSSSSCACVRAFFQAHTIALERVEQQGNLAKQKAEDATEQAQEALREATASKLLAQVPPSLVVSVGKLLYSKRLCGLAPPLCCALSSSSCVCVRALFQGNFIALERALQTAKTELTKEREEAEGRTTAAREALGMAIRHKLSRVLHCAFAWYTY